MTEIWSEVIVEISSFNIFKLSCKQNTCLFSAYWCFHDAFDYYNDNGDDDDYIVKNNDIHCRPSISLLATLLGTRIFCYNPTRSQKSLLVGACS